MDSRTSLDDKFGAIFELLSAMNARMGELSERMGNVETSVAELSKTVKQQGVRLEQQGVRLEQQGVRLEQQGVRIAQMQSDTSKIGGIFEILARQELIKKYGQDYGRGFDVKDLYGLARAAFPKGKSLEDGKIVEIPASSEQTAELTRRVTCLAHAAKRSADNLVGLDKSSLNLGRMKAYRELTSENDQLEFLSRDPLGLWALSLNIYSQTSSELQKQHFDSCYQFDVRGSVEVLVLKERVIVDFHCGEVKCGHDFSKSVSQLLKRLCILAKAAEVLLETNMGSKSLEFVLKGEIVGLTDWKKNVEKLVIREELDRLLLKEPNGEIFLAFERL